MNNKNIIKTKQLPLECNGAKQYKSWISHPKIFFNTKNKENITCKYCNTIYKKI